MCKHHWLIDTPGGQATVGARCKLCGAERAFDPYPEPDMRMVRLACRGDTRTIGSWRE